MSVFPWFYALFHTCLCYSWLWFYFTSVHLWLCILFLLIVNLLLILGSFWLCVCICSFLPSVSSVFVRRFVYFCSLDSFQLIQTVLGYVWVWNFPCLHLTFSVICFLVMNALFNCFVPCLLHLLLPLQPFFLCVCLLSVLCVYVFRRHFMLFSPLYATMIAIVIIVFIIVLFGQVRIILKSP